MAVYLFDFCARRKMTAGSLNIAMTGPLVTKMLIR